MNDQVSAPPSLVGAVLQDVQAFGPILVLTFDSELKALFWPVVDPQNAHAMNMVTAKGPLPRLVLANLGGVIPLAVQDSIVNRAVLSQEVGDNRMTLGLGDGWQLCISADCGLSVLKDGVALPAEIVG